MATSAYPNGRPAVNQLDYVLEHFEGVKETGAGFKARCPGPHHTNGDRNPSLSITEKDGTILLHCFGSCDTAEVVKAAGLTMGDLFTDNKPPAKVSQLRRVVTSYVYTDAAGAPIARAVRYEPKRFEQHRPDGKGGWVRGVKGIDIPLYNMPGIVRSDGPIFKVEGEKDADRLNAAGLTATTNIGGSNRSAWKPWHTEVLALAGLDVVILPDNDAPGRDHADRVAAELTAAGCLVKVVTLPGLPDAGDVSDWLDARHTVDELMQLVADAEPYSLSHDSNNDNGDGNEPGLSSVTHTLMWGDSYSSLGDSVEDENGFVVESLADLLTAEIPEVDYVVDGLLTAGNSVLWSAREKTGKGLFFIDTAVNVATGQPVLGRTVKPGPVLYIALEENRRVIRDRFRARVDAATAPPIYIMTGQPLDIMGPDIAEHLRHTITTIGARLVVIDTLRETHERNENNSDEMAPVARVIRLLAEETGACIAVTHHMSLGNRSRGSTSIPAGFPDVVEYHADDTHDRLSGVLRGKGRDIIPFSQHIAFDGETMRWHIEEDEGPKLTNTEQAILDVLNSTDEWLSAADIATRAEKPRGGIRNALSAMRKRPYCPLLVEGEGRDTRYHGIQARTDDATQAELQP